MEPQLASAPAPWDLRGEAVVAFLGPHRTGLAAGPLVRRVPGPAVVLGASWQATPVGPYREFAIVLPSRIAWWPGGCVVEMVVDDESSLRAGRANWGMPKQRGQLSWDGTAPGAGLRWEERGIEVSAVRRAPGAPGLVAFPLVQVRDDGPIAIPALALARASPSWVRVDVPPADPLAGMAGRHPGLHLTGLRLHVGRGYRPIGLA